MEHYPILARITIGMTGVLLLLFVFTLLGSYMLSVKIRRNQRFSDKFRGKYIPVITEIITRELKLSVHEIENRLGIKKSILNRRYKKEIATAIISELLLDLKEDEVVANEENYEILMTEVLRVTDYWQKNNKRQFKNQVKSTP